MPRGPWGERHRWAKLTLAQVQTLCASTEPTSVRARRSGVGWSTVAGVRTRTTWRHAEQESAQAGLAPFTAPDLPPGAVAFRLSDRQRVIIDAADAVLASGHYWFLHTP